MAVPQGPGFVQTVGANVGAVNQAGGMSHQVMSGDGPVIGLHFEPRQIARHRRLQVQEPFIAELHQGDVCEGLADGADLEHRAGLDRRARSQVGIAEGGYPEQPLPVGNRQGHTRHVDLADTTLHVPVDFLKGSFKARHWSLLQEIPARNTGLDNTEPAYAGRTAFWRCPLTADRELTAREFPVRIRSRVLPSSRFVAG